MRVILASLFWINQVPQLALALAPMHESICSRFERKCNKERPGDGFMIYQKHFTIWQSSLAQISKCLLYGRRAGILLIWATSPGKGCSGHVTTGNPPPPLRDKKHCSIDRSASRKDGVFRLHVRGAEHRGRACQSRTLLHRLARSWLWLRKKGSQPEFSENIVMMMLRQTFFSFYLTPPPNF